MDLSRQAPVPSPKTTKPTAAGSPEANPDVTPDRAELHKVSRLAVTEARLIKQLAREFEQTGVLNADLVKTLQPFHADDSLRKDFERTLRGYGLASDLFDKLKNDMPEKNALPHYQSHVHAAPHHNGHDAPLYALTSTGMIAKDIYERPDHYSHSLDHETRETLKLALNNPDADIRIYRTVPKGVTGINPGDWITLSMAYAVKHNHAALDGQGEVLTRKVKARHVFWDGNDLLEMGYDPR